MAVLDRFLSFGAGKKRWSLVKLDKWPSHTVTILWELASADSALVVLDEWSSYKGGPLNRFDDICFQWKNEITNLTSGIRHYKIGFLMSFLHMTFRKTDL